MMLLGFKGRAQHSRGARQGEAGKNGVEMAASGHSPTVAVLAAETVAARS